MSNIFSNSVPVKEALCASGRFVLPAYQRPYSWTWEIMTGKRFSNGPAKALMEDMLSAYYSHVCRDTDNDDPYLIGTIAYWEDGRAGEKVRVLVDGQQRVSTLLLFVSAAQSVMAEWEETTSFDFRSILVYRSDEDGQERTRIEATGRPECQEILDIIGVQGMDLPDNARFRGGASNMYKNWRAIRNWLIENFQYDRKEDETKGQVLMKFVRYVMNRTQVLCCKLPSEQMAMDYFRNQNGRGLPMSETNHIRCMFYSNLSGPEVEVMDKLWGEISHHIDEAYDARGGSADYLEKFLGYYLTIAATQTNQGIRVNGRRSAGALRASIRSLIEAEGGKTVTSKTLLRIVQDIAKSSSMFRYIVKGLTPKGKISPATETFPLINANASVHLIPLLAAGYLDEERYETVARALCDWWIVARMVSAHRSSNENVCLKVARILRDTPSKEDAVQSVLDFLNEEKSKHYVKFRENLMSSPVNFTENIRRSRMVILGSIEEYLKAMAGDPSNFKRSQYLTKLNKNGSVNKRVKQNYQIDHAHPQVLCRATEMEGCAHALGNLVVLPSSVNAQLQALPYTHPDKKQAYVGAGAQTYLSYIMVYEGEVRGNALHSETIKYGRMMGLGPYHEWTPKEVEARTKGLVEMAVTALGVSPPKPSDEDFFKPTVLLEA